MSNLRTLAKHTAVYGLSAIMSKFLNFLLTPYLTYILAPEIFGNVTLWYGLIPFVNVLLVMGLSTSYFRWAGKTQDAKEKKSIFASFFSVVSGAALAFFVLALIFRIPLTEMLEYGESRYIVMVALLILIDNVAAIPLAALREKGQALRYTIVNVSGIVINIACCIGFYSFIQGAETSAEWVVWANIIASASQLILLMFFNRSLLGGRIKMDLIRKALAYSLPLMLAGLMGMGSEFIDRQMLRWVLPDGVAMTQVGVYGAVAKLASVMIIFRQIYTLGAEPFFLQNFKKDDFLRMNAAALKYFLIIGITVALGCCFFLDVLILLLGESYRVGIEVVPILILANLLMGVLINLSFWYKVADRTSMAIWITGAGFVTIVVGCMLLIPRYGYVGAAWAHLISSAVMVVLSYTLNQIYYKVPYELSRLILYFMIGLLLYQAGAYIDTHIEAIGQVGVWIAKILLLLSFVSISAKKEGLKLEKLWKRK